MSDFRCEELDAECLYCANRACRICDVAPLDGGLLCPHDLEERHLGGIPNERLSADDLCKERRITERMPKLEVGDRAASVRVSLADPASVAAFFEMVARVVRAVSADEVEVVVTVTAVPADPR